MTSKIIDIHPHIITTDEQRYPRIPLGGKPSTWSQSRPTTWEQLLAAMDDAGVEKAAIVQSSTCYGFDNSYVADAVAARPDRFTGVFSVDMLAKDAPEKVRYWHERGLTGLRLFTTGSTMPGQSDILADPRTFPAWEAARDLGMTVCVQMRPEGLSMLQTLMDKFPTVRIIIDHFMSVPVESGPPYAGAAPLMSLANNPNIYLKLSTVALRAAHKGLCTPETFIGMVASQFGAKRIAWGSNFPASTGSLREMVQESQQDLAFMTPADLSEVFRETALSIYRALR